MIPRWVLLSRACSLIGGAAAWAADGGRAGRPGPVRGGVLHPARGADAGRPAAGRSPAAAAAARRDGTAHGRAGARPFAPRRAVSRTCSTRCFPAAKEQKAMLDAMSQFGVLLILLMTGMETDLKLVKESSRASISASVVRHHHSVRLRLRARRIPARRHDPGSEQAADHVAVPRHRAVDRLGEDRRHRGARDELPAPHRRPGDPRLRHRRRHHRLDHHRGDLRPGAAGPRRSAERRQERDRHAGLHGVQPDHRPPPGFAGDPLGQRHLRQRIRGHHRDPGDHGR